MTLDEIIEYMLSSVPEEYDISVGSFFYDLLYPVAEQIYLLQKRISRLSENTFAVTAEGEYLDRKTAEQNIVRKTATYSKGTLLISGNRGEVILKGAKVAADNVLFEVNETVSIAENGSVEVGATCTVSGRLSASTITIFTVPAPFQSGITFTSPTPLTSFAHSI